MNFPQGTIAQLRAKLGMTQAEFGKHVADAVGKSKITRETVSNWEEGKQIRSPDVFSFIQRLIEEHSDAKAVDLNAEADRLRKKLADAMSWLDLAALSRLKPLILEEMARCTREELARSS